MFLDLGNLGPRPEPDEPPPRGRLTERHERMIRWLVAFNLLMLLIGPLAGASILEAVVSIVRR